MEDIKTKMCKTCGEDKELALFPLKNGYVTAHCRKCSNRQREERRKRNDPLNYLERNRIKTQNWKKNNPEQLKLQKRAYNIKKNYGLTLLDYKNLVIAQESKCKICNKEFLENEILDIDHCHKSGKVRGLLCNDCNTMLGRAKDSIEILEQAIVYLKDNA